MSTGVTEVIERVTDDDLEEALARVSSAAGETRGAVIDLGITSVITAPLTTKRGVVGAMQFVSAESGRSYDRDDVALAEVVASRVADAADNMWLTAQHRQIASVLQRALLPPVLPRDARCRRRGAVLACRSGGRRRW